VSPAERSIASALHADVPIPAPRRCSPTRAWWVEDGRRGGRRLRWFGDRPEDEVDRFRQFSTTSRPKTSAARTGAGAYDRQDPRRVDSGRSLGETLSRELAETVDLVLGVVSEPPEASASASSSSTTTPASVKAPVSEAWLGTSALQRDGDRVRSAGPTRASPPSKTRSLERAGADLGDLDLLEPAPSALTTSEISTWCQRTLREAALCSRAIARLGQPDPDLQAAPTGGLLQEHDGVPALRGAGRPLLAASSTARTPTTRISPHVSASQRPRRGGRDPPEKDGASEPPRAPDAGCPRWRERHTDRVAVRVWDDGPVARWSRSATPPTPVSWISATCHGGRSPSRPPRWPRLVLAEGTVVVRRLLDSPFPPRAPARVRPPGGRPRARLAPPTCRYVTDADTMARGRGFHLNRGVLPAPIAHRARPRRPARGRPPGAVLEGVGDHENLAPCPQRRGARGRLGAGRPGMRRPSTAQRPRLDGPRAAGAVRPRRVARCGLGAARAGFTLAALHPGRRPAGPWPGSPAPTGLASCSVAEDPGSRNGARRRGTSPCASP